MKLKHLTTLLALLAMLGITVGCEEETAAEEGSETPSAEAPPEGETAEGAEDTADEAAADETAQAAEGGEEAAGGGSVCERAARCCEAYVDTLSGSTPGLSVEQACAGVQAGTGGDAACQAAIDGWRTGLEAASADVPEACQGS